MLKNATKNDDTKKPTTKPKIAFGTLEPRFIKWALHPRLDIEGAFSKKCPAQEPPYYHPIESTFSCTVNKNRKLSPWETKFTVQQWSMQLGYRNPDLLKYRKEQRAKLGPAWHYISEPVCAASVCQNVGFGVGRRFKTKVCDRPPPGVYYHEVPYKAPYGPHSKLEPFDWTEPCRFKDRTSPWFVAPNRYKPRDFGAQEELAKRVISLRGPYDLFTPERNDKSIKNHFGIGARIAATSFPIALEGCLERFKKRRLGKMCETGRDTHPRNRNTLTDIALAVKTESDPGPCEYSPIDERYVFKECKNGFNSSYDKERNYIRTIVWPAVGRYNPTKGKRCRGPPGYGHRSRFISKVKRGHGFVVPPPMNSF